MVLISSVLIQIKQIIFARTRVLSQVFKISMRTVVIYFVLGKVCIFNQVICI